MSEPMTAPSAAMRAAEAVMLLFKERDRLAHAIRNGNTLQAAVARDLLAKTIDAALAASPAGEAWRPIEEFPVDRRYRLVWCPELQNIHQVTRDAVPGAPNTFRFVGGDRLWETPTHFRDMPAPPAEAGSTKE